MKKFKEVDSKFDLVSLENDTLKFWEENNIYEKVISAREKNDEWVYYDGPITANGMPHYGHAITWTMKDIMPRYWTMKGYFVDRNMGWDCQGILVEYEVEKQLKFKNKDDIEEYGIDNFNQKCRESVLKFRESMISYETRLGRWLNNNNYVTMEADYIESIWWSIKELYEKDLLYEGHKVVAYSTRAGMTLSSHEVADGGYKEIIDPGVTIKFKLKDEDASILAWTTTPWTLPGNLMLSIGRKIKYVKVKATDGNIYILAEDALERVFGDVGYNIVEVIEGEDLVNKEYEPLFPFYSHKSDEGAFKVIYADHVNTEEGTGVVHLAPYGEDDFNIFLSMGMDLFDYLDESGKFTDEIPAYSGMFYKKANKQIIKDLTGLGKLYKVEDYPHQMPICYRTKEPLIYKPIKSWYLAVNKIKPRLVEEAKKINFVPEEGAKRFNQWIDGARDWSLSRRRYWGTPMPIWVNDVTGDIKFIGSFKELEELSGQTLGDDFDPHKPFVDEITWKSDGGTYKRVPEVLDVWYDSGSMSFAQHHYPFENKEIFETRYPAQYISESDDQIRLWFYTLFLLGMSLFDEAPFKNVIVTGMLGDDKGKKMSKSKGNYPPVEEVFDNYGSDMLRYFLLSSNIARGMPTAFSYENLQETKKEFFTMLWNSYRYFVTYANLNEFSVSEPDLEKLDNVLDIWILTRLNETIKNVEHYMDNFEVMYATRELPKFISDLSTWYIRRSRDRISSGELDSLNVLYKSLIDMSKLMAPFMPLLAESIYKNLSQINEESDNIFESVHLAEFPSFDSEFVERNKNLLSDMEQVRRISSLGNSIRKEIQIPVRQPLASLYVSGIKVLSPELLSLIQEELNVKEVLIVEKIPSDISTSSDLKLIAGYDINITEELRLEGISRELVREIQKLRKEANVAWDDVIEVEYVNSEEYIRAVELFSDDIKQKTLTKKLVPGSTFKVL